jgi:hypothetical protein
MVVRVSRLANRRGEPHQRAGNRRAWLWRLVVAPLGRFEPAPQRSSGLRCRLGLAPALICCFFSLLL